MQVLANELARHLKTPDDLSQFAKTFYQACRCWKRLPVPGTTAIHSWQTTYSLTTFFAYPTDTRKVIDTTNAIESLNSVIRHAIKKRKVFPTDESVKKRYGWRFRRPQKNDDAAERLGCAWQ